MIRTVDVALRFNIRRRLMFVAIGVAVFLLTYSVGAGVKLTPDDAAQVRKDFKNQIGDIDETGIFVNNVRIALIMFVPALGVALGIFSGYVTGNVFAALAESSPILSSVPPQIILLTPFGVMEVFTYGLAMSRSGLLVYYIVRRRSWREYVVPTLVELGIATAILFVAAMIEWWMIQEFGGGLTFDPKFSL